MLYPGCWSAAAKQLTTEIGRHGRHGSRAGGRRNNCRLHTPGDRHTVAAMAVHHGATGTLMAACKHCKPMVIVPFVLDQPEHAERMQGLIGAPIVPAARYDRNSATHALLSAHERQQSMRAQLRELMNDYSDGAERAAHQILATLRA